MVPKQHKRQQQPCQPSQQLQQQPSTAEQSSSSTLSHGPIDLIDDDDDDKDHDKDHDDERAYSIGVAIPGVGCKDEPQHDRSEAEDSEQQQQQQPAEKEQIEEKEEEVDDENENAMSIPWSLVKSIAAQALALTVQEWTQMGQNEDPTISETAMFEDMMIAVDRVASLLLVRIVALQYHQVMGSNHQQRHPNNNNNNKSKSIHKNHYYDQEELSTSSICRHALLSEDHPWPFITKALWQQVKEYVLRMLQGYSSSLPFHNSQHAATVVISCNKLIDLALTGTHNCYGLRENPLWLVALLMAALVHDVKHHGVKNAQLAIENDALALLYNDRSIQEKNSLHFAFAELLRDDYCDFRQALFGHDDAKYRYFRNTVVSAVMATDLACPEQTALTRSKWKEAFADKPNLGLPRRGSGRLLLSQRGRSNCGKSRRGSNCSEVSEVTLELPSSSVRLLQRNSAKNVVAPCSPTRRRLSSDSNYATQRWIQQRQRKSSDGDSTCNEEYATDSVALMQKSKTTTAATQASAERDAPHRTYSEDTRASETSSFMSVAAESIGIHQKRLDGDRPTRRRSRLLVEHSVPLKFDTSGDESSGSVTSSDEEQEYGGTTFSGMKMVVDRRRESANAGSYRKRLGIRRSIDFSGEAIEVYSRRNSLGGVSALSGEHEFEESQNEGLDYLRATAVLELLMRAADVGHFLQGWDNMTQWSSRMFLELQRAHKNGRGPDPSPDWLDNQIKVIDLYLRPLAYQLDECGVFGDFAGAMFAEIVDDINARWLIYGKELTDELRQIDPSESSFLPTESSCYTTTTSDHDSVDICEVVSSPPPPLYPH